MKKFRNTLLYMLTALVLFPSCNEWLTIEPENGVIKENYWSTKEEVYAAVIGLYSGMLNKDFQLRMYLWGELRGETLLTNETYVNANYQSIRDGEIVSTNPLCNWATFYNIINFCNTVVDCAAQAQESDPSFTDAMVKQYQAEAIAVRSLLYFYLVRTFRDVPYYTEPYVSDDQTMMIAKADGDSILSCLTVDLEAIAPDIAARYEEGNAAMNKGRMTRGAVYSLLADIYLWQGKYDDCIRNCDKVLNSGEYSLLLNGRSHLIEDYVISDISDDVDTFYYLNAEMANEYYKQMYVDGNCDESIFEIQYELEYPNNAYYDLFNNSNGDFMANSDMIKENYFIPSEISPKSWTDLRGEDVAYKSGYVWKTLGTNRDGKLLEACKVSQDYWDNNVIVYRLAEIYLMKAEALVEQAAKLDDTTGEMRIVPYTADSVGHDTTYIDVIDSTLYADSVLEMGSIVCDSMFYRVTDGDTSTVVYTGHHIEPNISAKIVEYTAYDTVPVLNNDQQEKLAEALELIQTLRTRANATEMTDLCYGTDIEKDGLTASTMEEFVYQERVREMMFEGKRWFDALRFAKRDNYAENNLNYLLQMAVYGASVTKVGTLQNKLKNVDFHYLPIYKSELEANKLLVQNPFYND